MMEPDLRECRRPDDDEERDLKQHCYRLLGFHRNERANLRFPGSYPMSLNRDNLDLLRQRYYYATWKAIATRYMLLITTNQCYFIDKNFEFRIFFLRFPCKSSSAVSVPTDELHNYTLLDGEMIIDTLPETGEQLRRYLVSDVMAVNNVSVFQRPFSERFELIYEEVIKPRDEEKHKHPYLYSKKLGVRRKGFWALFTATKILNDVMPKLTHGSDGLIFQCWDDAYVPGTHDGLLKWKCPEKNSVDLLHEFGTLYSFKLGKRITLEEKVKFTDPIHPINGFIGCYWNFDEKVWVCTRTSVNYEAKLFNTFKSYSKAMRNITKEEISKEINLVIGLPGYAGRIQKLRGQTKGSRLM